MMKSSRLTIIYMALCSAHITALLIIPYIYRVRWSLIPFSFWVLHNTLAGYVVTVYMAIRIACHKKNMLYICPAVFIVLFRLSQPTYERDCYIAQIVNPLSTDIEFIDYWKTMAMLQLRDVDVSRIPYPNALTKKIVEQHLNLRKSNSDHEQAIKAFGQVEDYSVTIAERDSRKFIVARSAHGLLRMTIIVYEIPEDVPEWIKYDSSCFMISDTIVYCFGHVTSP
jgi:hypothetical protein